MNTQNELEFLGRIGKIADSLGYSCFVVGGWVRDYFLGVQPNDFDIFVLGDHVEVSRLFARERGLPVSMYRSKIHPNEPYGIMRVDCKDGRVVEFSGTKKNPEKTIEESLEERDFTINSIAIRINSLGFGEIVDPFSGISDLHSGRITTIRNPVETFLNDPLRMLRCIRFSSGLKFRIDEAVLQSIRENHSLILSIPVERISAELLRILGNNDNGLGIKLLHNSGLLQDILPEVAALDTTDNGRHKNNFYHTIEVYQNISRETQNPWLRLAALLHDIGKERCKKYNSDQCTWTFFGHPEVGGKMVEDIFKRLKLSREKMEYVKKLVRLHMRPQKIADTGVTDSAVRRVLVEAGDDIWDLLLLSKCDVTTKHSDKKARMQETIDVLEQKIKELQVLDWRREFQPCVNGRDIMELYNIKGGPLVGYLKDSIKRAVLDGEIPNERETIINYLNTLYENYKNNPNVITGMA